MVAGVAELTRKRSAVADRAAGKVVVDCSNVRCLSGDMLSKLILLQGRLKQRHPSSSYLACVLKSVTF